MTLDEIQKHRDSMRRAHRMSCSDPTDPKRETTYSVSADAIDTLLRMLKEAQLGRVITTLEELVELPNTAVIRDKLHDVAERRSGMWCSYETIPLPDREMAKFLPGRVLDEGTGK